MNDESNTGSGVDLRTKLPAGGNRIPPGYIHPSAAFSIRKNQIRAYSFTDHEPRCGDVVYGKVTRLGFHSNLENKSGRLHVLNDGSKSIFVFGNRYAPDHYEGLVPGRATLEVDLLFVVRLLELGEDLAREAFVSSRKVLGPDRSFSKLLEVELHCSVELLSLGNEFIVQN